VVAERRCTWADSVHPGNSRTEELSPRPTTLVGFSSVNLFCNTTRFLSKVTSSGSLFPMRFVTASLDGTARIWDVLTGNEIAVLRGHEHPLRSVS
jgi:WD40 repeat protein